MPGTQVVAPLEYTVFGDFLKYLRRRAQLTQAELAIACGYSTPHVSHLENNLRLPDQATLLALFVPALGLQDKPDLVERLLELAAEARARALAGDTAPQVAPAPGNLPPQPTPFVGRLAELARIAALLDNPACRLLTLIGPGGIGKTRLALQAAAEQAARFAHGAFFVALAGLGAPEHLVAATAQAIGFVFRSLSSFSYGGGPPPDEPRVQLLDYLRPKSLLLVMDNFEHLRAGAELLSAVVQGAPSVKLLVTSREPLALREEWLFQVEGLEVPGGDVGEACS